MSKYDEYRSRLPRVTERFPALAEAFGQLTADQDRHFDLVWALSATNGPGNATPLFAVDLVLLSVLNRSLDLIAGFTVNYDRWNLTMAAPAVRMQVDNVLRLTLLLKAPAGSVTDLLLAGTPLNRAPDPLAKPGEKHKLTDQRLRDHARDMHPWLDLVYEKSSGWVHFSSVHVGVTVHVTDDGQIFGRFPSDIDRYPIAFLEQVLWAMRQATTAVLSVADNFAEGKRARLAGGAATDSRPG